MKLQNREVHQVGAVDMAPVVDKLNNIERLLVLLVAKLGADSTEVGATLDLHPGAARKRFSFSKVRRATIHAEQDGADSGSRPGTRA